MLLRMAWERALLRLSGRGRHCNKMDCVVETLRLLVRREQKAIADNEAKERLSLLGKFRNLEHAADGGAPRKEHRPQLTRGIATPR